MIVKILGSAAGGGFPQWNCNTRLSRMAWDGDSRVRPRTQSSIGVAASSGRWVIFNASPDLRQQIAATPCLQPRADGGVRNSPIAAVVLTNGDVDHIAGLLALRERQPFKLYATQRVLRILEDNSIFNVLAPPVVERLALRLGERTDIAGTGIMVETFPVPGKVALFLEDVSKGPGFGTEMGDTVGLRIEASSSGVLVYVPGCASVDDTLLSHVRRSEYLLFDGTVYNDGEMLEAGVGEKTGRRMGHVPITGDGGSLHAFDATRVPRKAYIHVNTTNPILERGSDAESVVKAAGWDVAYDGMSIEL